MSDGCLPAGGPPAGGAALALRNQRVRRLRRLVRDPRARRAEQAFVLEGPNLVEAAVAAQVPLEAVYVAPGGDGAVVERARAAGAPVRKLAPGVIERVADAVSPQPVLAVAPLPDTGLEELRSATLVVVCVGLQDPGNLGSVVRGASAAGAAAVICCDGTVDPFGPKCVRGSAGALFHVRLVTGRPAVEVLDELGSWGVRRLGARPRGGVVHHRADLRGPTAFVLGNESHGLAPEVEALLDGLLTIPMVPGVESLNVAAAASVLCFEAARQRETVSPPGRPLPPGWPNAG
ncbi:MAG TPA: RNA methyltransferase [Acidimicrobiales bacterium]|nr:RNA methyltransferase [Acidimicrobiales bacterium]